MELLHFIVVLCTTIIFLKLVYGALALGYSYVRRELGFGPCFTPTEPQYAVVTGATGVLGREFAYEFALMGYNLILIAKDSRRLDRLEKKLRMKCDTLKQCIKIQSDFTRMESFDTIKQRLDSIKGITVLCNCASYCPEPLKFHEIPTQSKKDSIMINIMAPTLMMDMLLPKFMQQDHGIIINVGSQSGDFRFPYYSTFAAAKSYVHTMTEVVAAEIYFDEPLYLQTIKPCFVATDSSGKSDNLRESIWEVSANSVTYSSLLALGIESSTYGHWKHRITGFLFNTSVFLFGHRCTTFLVKFFINHFVKLDKTSRSDTTLSSGGPNISPPKKPVKNSLFKRLLAKEQASNQKPQFPKTLSKSASSSLSSSYTPSSGKTQQSEPVSPISPDSPDSPMSPASPVSPDTPQSLIPPGKQPESVKKLIQPTPTVIVEGPKSMVFKIVLREKLPTNQVNTSQSAKTPSTPKLQSELSESQEPRSLEDTKNLLAVHTNKQMAKKEPSLMPSSTLSRSIKSSQTLRAVSGLSKTGKVDSSLTTSATKSKFSTSSPRQRVSSFLKSKLSAVKKTEKTRKLDNRKKQ